MSSIVYLTNKTTGIKYAYESESFRDPVTHKPKNKRKLIGKWMPMGTSSRRSLMAHGGGRQQRLAHQRQQNRLWMKRQNCVRRSFN